MEPRFEYSAAGKFMYRLCGKGARFLYKHPVIYWILICTWGSLWTIIGGLIWLCLLPFAKETGRFGRSRYMIFGGNWGGLSTGCFMMIGRCYAEWEEHTKHHEMGHMYQLALLGPLHIFMIEIPSAIRYWYRRLSKNNQKDYDAIWFEGSATDIGYDLYK